MLLYYFTCANYGLENLRNRRLKISDFSNLNDPIEMMGIQLANKGLRRTIRLEKRNITEKIGLLCFSEDKHNPVQWAHYADKHQGLCLGFEIPEKRVQKVEYVLERLAKENFGEPNCIERLLTTKFKHWEYEKERRILLKLSEYHTDIKGLRFESFGGDLLLKEIFIGCRSRVSFEDIASAYSSGDNSVIVKTTRPAFRTFRIVWDRSKKSIKV